MRQAIASAIPLERKKYERDHPKLGPLKDAIERMLEADRQAPRKQRHTAHRIWVRLRKEYPNNPVAEVTARQYVRELAEFERPMPVMDEYDLLLNAVGGVQ